MNFRRVGAILLQEVFISIHSLEVFIDLIVFPVINIAIFGLISLYLAGSNESTVGQYVLIGMVLWQAVATTAYSLGVGVMWNIWSRNLSNMFVAPLRTQEYIGALFVSGCIKAVILVAIGACLSAWVFHFNIVEVGIGNLALSFVIFALFGFAIAMVSVGLIFRFGTRLAALSWSITYIFQPLSAAFFPLAALPHGLQIIARGLPPTYAFEAVREGLSTHMAIDWGLFATGFGLDCVYCVAGILIFRYLFAKSRKSGQFARNEA